METHPIVDPTKLKLDGSNAQIKIIQKKNSLEVLCDFNEEANRFDASIVFTDVQFQ